ncbi:MAG: hypothetical protein N4A70_02520 [Pelagimonas sp.]|jgi:hypothetical protein|nr:hypothetical protein [Pelagimonas sp.]
MVISDIFNWILAALGHVPGLVFLIWAGLATLFWWMARAEKDSDWLRSKPVLMHWPYHRLRNQVLTGLSTLFLPKETEETHPKPTKGWVAKFEWHLTPRAKDSADLARLRQNPWSWPVLLTAVTLAIIYPILTIFTQWVFTGHSTGLDGVAFLPDNIHWVWRYGAFGVIASAIVFRSGYF